MRLSLRLAMAAIAAIFISSCDVYYDVFPGVAIDLDQPMYDVFGKRVKSVKLQPGRAAILQIDDPNQVNKTAFSQSGKPRPNKTVRLGGYFFGGFDQPHKLSQKQMEWVATHLDVLSLNSNYVIEGNPENGGITPEGVLWLKQRNPDLRYYCMLFATTLREPQFDPATMSNWVVEHKDNHEAYGVRRSTEGDLNHLMDLGNADYAKWFRNFMIKHANEYHADGVAIDEVMWNGYWGLDLKDMKDYNSVDQIRQTCYDWLKTIKTDNPKEVIHQAFWSEAQEFTNGVWGEAAFYSSWRDGTEYEVFYEDLDYRGIVNKVSEFGDKDETYIWASFYFREEELHLEYAVATYLLGKKGDHVVFQPQPIYDGGYPKNLGGYSLQTVMDEYERRKNIFDVELGQPLGEFYTEEIHNRIIWVRKFEKGIVYVNPNKN
ncbi:MAG TPA: putative glycoside hydrolase [Cyclobacteriaceae bacterium]|nr:putative glycoside hydrolase [Cyclobacteriaceae bacterium]